MTIPRPKQIRQVLLLGLGCALFIYLLIRLHPVEILTLLREIGWYFGAIAAIYGLYEVVRAFALRQCITGDQLPTFRDVLRIRISGDAVQFLTLTGPFLAQPTMAAFLRARGLTTAQAFAATVSELLVYTFTSAAMSIAGAAYFLYRFDLSRPVAITAQIILYTSSAFLLVAVYAITRRIYLIGTILRGVSALPLLRRLGINHSEVRHTEDLLFAVLRQQPLRFLSITATELAAQVLLILELLVLLWATGQRFSLLDPILIESITKFASAGFFFIPGQVGVTEGAYAIVFHEIGLAASAGFALALARRLRSLLLAGAGLASASLWRSTSVAIPGDAEAHRKSRL